MVLCQSLFNVLFQHIIMYYVQHITLFGFGLQS